MGAFSDSDEEEGGEAGAALEQGFFGQAELPDDFKALPGNPGILGASREAGAGTAMGAEWPIFAASSAHSAATPQARAPSTRTFSSPILFFSAGFRISVWGVGGWRQTG